MEKLFGWDEFEGFFTLDIKFFSEVMLTPEKHLMCNVKNIFLCGWKFKGERQR